MDAIKILENVKSLGTASNSDVLNMISSNSSQYKLLLTDARQYIKKGYESIENFVKSETNENKKTELIEEFNSFKIQVARFTSGLKVQRAHLQSNTRQYKKLVTILSELINNSSQLLDQDTAKEIKDIKDMLQKNKDNLLKILQDRKIFDDFQNKLNDLQTIKHKKKYATGIGLLATLLSGGAIGAVAGIEGCCGAAGCITLFGLMLSGVGLVLLGCGLALGVGIAVGLATYKIFKNSEKNFGNSKEMKEIIQILEKQNQLIDSTEASLQMESNLDELEQIFNKIGLNPLKHEEDKDICQRLSNENDEIIKCLNAIIEYNESIQNIKF